MTLQETAIIETYRDVEKMLAYIAASFSKRSRLSYGDLLSEAKLTFIKCYHNFDESKGCSFSSWLYFKTWMNLATMVRRDIQRISNVETELCEEITANMIEDFSTFAFDIQNGLSEDAKTIVKLVIDAPKELTAILKWTKSKTTSDLQKEIQEYLAEHDWSPEDFEFAVAEIIRKMEHLKKGNEETCPFDRWFAGIKRNILCQA